MEEQIKQGVENKEQIAEMKQKLQNYFCPDNLKNMG